MTKLINIGNYLDREVLFLRVNSLQDLESHEKYSDSMVALFLGQPLNAKNISAILNSLVKKSPLGILIIEEKDQIFDNLLEILSVSNTEKHIMTASGNYDNWLDVFFLGTFPSEDRSNEWKSYLVVEYFVDDEDSILTKEIIKYIS
ncbi:hypothetical protein LPTSP3_g07460 [Leptospira kobayashii]|uniref:Uncharacterized protein n=1 Tax=Leptospira kobayashii TaxID=1917830 RepID=A0ABM7UGY8_9LEPT|nr:hypothetical protein [Leptospira kobayashii]BDA77816.1 hypothetical protein LPTSP3_g07460 [Leptospira kobayashii]